MIPTNLHAALYDATKLAERIESALIETGGEITPELSQLLEFKDYKENDLIASIDATIMSIERLEKAIDYYEEQIESLQKLQKSIVDARKRFIDNLTHAMQSLEIDELKGLQRAVKFRSNPPSVEILDESLIPFEFKAVEIKERVDKRKVREALESGVQLGGARLVQGRSLRFSASKAALEDKND